MKRNMVILALAASFSAGLLVGRDWMPAALQDDAVEGAAVDGGDPLGLSGPEVDPVDPAIRSERIYATVQDVERLRSLPYATATFDPLGQQRGVVLHDAEKAFDGLNFYCSRDLPAAFLVDMEGRFVYQWRARTPPWQHVELLPDGHVLALVKERGMIEVDLQSDILWAYRARVHHDHWRAADGRIYVLSRKSEPDPRIHPTHRILTDYVTVLSPQGELLDEISVLDLVLDSPFAFLLPSVRHRDWRLRATRAEDVELDLLHTNHIEQIAGVEGLPAFTAGRFLLSFRHIDTIAVADLETRTLVWAWGPSNLARQHHPVQLPGGNLLIFNNGLKEAQVLELDPRSLEIVWTYSDGASFFSSSRGSNQRLPNGNTLITESDTGYVFEVTRSGEKVWEFANPQINEESERTAIWRMVRFARDELPFLAESR